jgi:hypothetical protein
MRLGASSFNGNSLSNNNGIMTPNDVMSVTSGVPTPWNAGDNKEIRSQPVVRQHRNFSQQEAADLTVKAANDKRQAQTNRQAYKALKSIEGSDVSNHTQFRAYQTTIAKGAAARKSADTNKAKALHGLTPAYARMGYSLGAAHDAAKVKVAEYQALYSEVGNRWR